jgi:hypothetical protein
MPRHPTLRALIRACTISFGSICVGSLFVAIVQTLHAIAQCIANEQRGHEFLFSCVNCFLGILDNLIQYFNKWAFVQVKYFELLLYVVHSGLWFVWLRDTSCYQKEKTSHTYLVWRWKGQSPNLIPPNIHLAGGSSWEEFCEGSKGHMGSVSNPTCGYIDQ